MERRDFLKALGALGGATALSALPLPAWRRASMKPG